MNGKGGAFICHDWRDSRSPRSRMCFFFPMKLLDSTKDCPSKNQDSSRTNACTLHEATLGHRIFCFFSTRTRLQQKFPTPKKTRRLSQTRKNTAPFFGKNTAWIPWKEALFAISKTNTVAWNEYLTHCFDWKEPSKSVSRCGMCSPLVSVWSQTLSFTNVRPLRQGKVSFCIALAFLHLRQNARAKQKSLGKRLYKNKGYCFLD